MTEPRRRHTRRAPAPQRRGRLVAMHNSFMTLCTMTQVRGDVAMSQPVEWRVYDTAGHRTADAAAANAGVARDALMRAAGHAVADAIARRWAPRPTWVACGPGDNGGDGYRAAARLRAGGWPVRVAATAPASGASPAARAARAAWAGPVEDLAACVDSPCGPETLCVDAVFGAGLSRPLSGPAAAFARAATSLRAAGGVVIAVDAPSGVRGDDGGHDGPVVAADLTVTFWRKKPVHLLAPGRSLCGEVVVADIGHPAVVNAAAAPVAWENAPVLWPQLPPDLARETHKHARGRVAVATGPAGRTGAARLAARAGLRAGAGLATLLAPPDAMAEVAAQSTAVMTRSVATPEALAAAAAEAHAVVVGPGFGVERARAATPQLLAAGPPAVLDADALTAFEDDPATLLNQLRPSDVLTPHAGEFRRLFRDLADRDALSAARHAADRCGAVMVLKGPATIIAAPGHVPVINVHATPALATAGSGDVLAGVIAALLAQTARACSDAAAASAAACAGVWLHGEAGRRCGGGLIAEDLPDALPAALRDLARRARKTRAWESLKRPIMMVGEAEPRGPGEGGGGEHEI